MDFTLESTASAMICIQPLNEATSVRLKTATPT